MINYAKLFIFLICPLSFPPAFVYATVHPTHFYGTYTFENGQQVHGGRFDEAGESLLLYMDTDKPNTGVVLKPKENYFVPAFNFGKVARVEFDDNYSTQLWTMVSGEKRVAKRTMKPVIKEVSFRNQHIKLAGNLYLPQQSTKSLSVVILAHGSGPTTRHAGTWTIFFNQLGLGVLAIDKRGTGGSEGNWEKASYKTLASDLAAAADWLSSQQIIEVDKIGLHTSSQSGWYGAYTAKKNNKIDFLIQRAAPAVNIALGTAHELHQEWRQQGISETDIAYTLGYWFELHEFARQGLDLENAAAFHKKAMAHPWFKQTFADWTYINPHWWARISEDIHLEPAEDAAKLTIPILWFLADLDENVPYFESTIALLAAQHKSNHITVHTIRSAKHSFFLVGAEDTKRYTAQYWSKIKNWLVSENIIDPAPK